MHTEKIEKLFSEYEKAFNALDMRAIAHHYADNFISAGPKGTIAQTKEQFLKMSEQAGEMYKSLGQNSAKILSKRIGTISKEYYMVTVHWGVTFEKTGNKLIEFDITYFVYLTSGEPKIIMFISHQDEEEEMKKLGLKPEFMKQ